MLGSVLPCYLSRKRFALLESVERMEHTVATGTTSLQAAEAGSYRERHDIRAEMNLASARLVVQHPSIEG